MNRRKILLQLSSPCKVRVEAPHICVVFGAKAFFGYGSEFAGSATLLATASPDCCAECAIPAFNPALSSAT